MGILLIRGRFHGGSHMGINTTKDYQFILSSRQNENTIGLELSDDDINNFRKSPIGSASNLLAKAIDKLNERSKSQSFIRICEDHNCKRAYVYDRVKAVWEKDPVLIPILQEVIRLNK